MSTLQHNIEEAIKRWHESEPSKCISAIETTAIVTGRAENYHGLTVPDFLLQELTSIYTLAQEEARKEKDFVYRERNQLVAALSKVFPSYLARHDENDATWDKDWMWIVYVNIPVRKKFVSGDQHNHVPEKDLVQDRIPTALMAHPQ